MLGLALYIARINRLALALIFVLVSPFAVRWLTDGMETSLAGLLSLAFSILLYRRAPPAVLALMALVLSLLRVDLTLLVAFGAILMIDQGERLRAGALCVGSGVSLAFIRLTMGHLLPDTALAKVGLRFFDVFAGTAHEIAGTFSFGIGVLLVWAASAVSAWRIDRRSALIANLPFPVLMLLAAARGQQIHGVRYIIWALLFSIAWNLMATAAVPSPRPVLLSALACVLIVCWIFELPVALRIDRGRSANLSAMENGHLDQLRGEGLAEDVGFVGYFSAAPICDLSGLVNGRVAAQMTIVQRTEVCLARKPSFLFLSGSQIGYLDNMFRLNSQSDWLDCGHVDFPNVGSDDSHWLLVRRTAYPAGCPANL